LAPDVVHHQELGHCEVRWPTLARLLRVLGPDLVPAPAGRPAGDRRQSVACRGCGTAIGVVDGALLQNKPLLCLSCLARCPGAPLGERLRTCRLAAGLTLRELAVRTGMAAQHLSAYERGRMEPRWERLTRLIRALGADLVTLGVVAGSAGGRRGRAERKVSRKGGRAEP
jgi:hypothetical protein